jgi:hypothetical protein
MSGQDPYRIPGTDPPEPTQAAEHPRVEQRSLIAIIVAVAAVLVAMIAALFSCLQWKAADRQTEIADRALKLAEKSARDQALDIERSRKAADRSATAAERSAAVADEALKSELATRLPHFSHNLGNLQPLTANTHITGDVLLNNTGTATAYDVTLRQWFQLGDANASYLPHNNAQMAHYAAIGTGSHIIIGLVLATPLTPDDLAEIKAGKKTLFLYGDIDYLDDHKGRHKYEWCSYYLTDHPDVFGMLPDCRFHISER